MSRRTVDVVRDPDALADMERERDILLRELDELDEQLRLGEISTEQHTRLSEAITGRAAAAIIAAERGAAARREGTGHRRSFAATMGIVVGIIVVAVTAGWLLIDQLAPRVGPTPDARQVAAPEQRGDRLAEVVEEDPTDVPARLAYARSLIEQGDLPGALEQYDAATEIDPSNAEALTYGGWLSVLTGSPDGLERLDRAVTTAPDYPDAHALRGLARMRAGDRTGALDDLTHYLELAPQGPLAPQVQQLIDELGAAT